MARPRNSRTPLPLPHPTMASRSPTINLESRDSSPVVLDAAADPQSGQDVFCKLCLSLQPPAATRELQSCKCMFCTAVAVMTCPAFRPDDDLRECLQQYVQLAIIEVGAPITCPDMACPKSGVLPDSEIASLAAPHQAELYQRLKFERGVKLDPSKAWCPVLECQAVCSVQASSEGRPAAVACPTCHTVFCSSCRGSWLDGHTCHERQPMIPPSLFDESSDSDVSIKQCPMCGVYIERNQGCAQMLCKSCKHTFCWYCLQNLDGDIFLRHYDKGPCRNKLGHSRASVMWNRTQVVGILMGVSIIVLVTSPLLLLASPCILCCMCKPCGRKKKKKKRKRDPSLQDPSSS